MTTRAVGFQADDAITVDVSFRRALRASQRLHQFEATDVLEIVEADVRRRHRQIDDGQKQAVLGRSNVRVEVFPRHPLVAIVNVSGLVTS